MILKKLVSYSRLKASRFYSSRNVLKLKDRGLLAQIFPNQEQYAGEILDLVNTGKQSVYAGFDPTASSLHIGNLAILMKLMHWQRSGQQPIALLGGATGQIGDPSGRKSERPILLEDDVNKNAEQIGQTIKTIFENHERYFADGLELKPVKIVNNLQWWGTLPSLDFIGKVGRNFRLGDMLIKHVVRSRMESKEGISFTEFTYQILQAYDWLRLYKDYGCRFQVGGNDQLGNIISGHDLIGRVEEKRVYGLTVPLILNKYGDKFGKTADLPPVWLSGKLLSPFDFYQFFVRAEDLEVEHLLKLYTFEPLKKIEDLMREHKKKPEQRLAQRALAHNVTLLIHGEKGLAHAKTLSSIFYEKDMEEFKALNIEECEHLFDKGMLAKLLLQPGITIVEAAVRAGCFPSETHALEMISKGAFSINMQKVQNPQEVINTSSHILPNNLSLMRVGKKHYTIVKWLT